MNISIRKWIVCGFGTGFIRPAPGTWGTIAAAIIFAVIDLTLPFLKPIFWILLFILGLLWIGDIENDLGNDAPQIVIDEFIGIGIVLIFMTFNWLHWLAAILIFRIFDIFKPLGINELQKMPGAAGIIFDDVLAGIYTLIFITGLMYLGVF